MSDNTKIEWTDATWTPIRARRFELQADGSGKERIGWHCEHVSPGCKGCYAERINMRLGTGREFRPAHLIHATPLGDVRGDVGIFLDETMLLQPLRWKRPREIFVCSMTDAFADFVSDEMLDRLFAVMALAHWHTFQVLTKRSARMLEYFSSPIREVMIGQQVGAIEMARSDSPVSEWSGLPMPHVLLGVSAEDQERFDERAADLALTPAARRFLSLEPLLGPINLSMRTDRMEMAPGIDWVIVGGESGQGARAMSPHWARQLRDQCAAAEIPFHFKQWGEWLPVDQRAAAGLPHVDSLDFDSLPELARALRVGKKAAGRLLDGVEHNGLPR